MSRADVKNSNRAAMLSLKGRVDFTCLICCNQTHFAFTVGHKLVGPSFGSVLCKVECFRHALEVSVWLVTSACFQRLLTTPHDHFMAQEQSSDHLHQLGA